jgi:hypothetical protein
MRRKQIELNGMDGSTVKDGFERNMCTIKTDILFFIFEKTVCHAFTMPIYNRLGCLYRTILILMLVVF